MSGTPYGGERTESQYSTPPDSNTLLTANVALLGEVNIERKHTEELDSEVNNSMNYKKEEIEKRMKEQPIQYSEGRVMNENAQAEASEHLLGGGKDYNNGLVIGWIAVLSLSSFIYGYAIVCFDVTTPVLVIQLLLPNYTDDITIFTAWVTSCIPIGAALGVLIAYPFTKIGRRWLIVGGNFLIVLGISLTMIKATAGIAIGRVIQGLGIGFVGYIAPLLASEVVPVQLRGMITYISSLMLAFGLLFCEFLGLMVPDPTKKYKDAKDTETWRIIFGLGLIAPVLQATLIPILFRFESPYFLITKGRSQECYTALRQIYRHEQRAHEELEFLTQMVRPSNTPFEDSEGEMAEAMASNTRTSFRQVIFFHKKEIFFGIFLIIYLQLSGVYGLFFYAHSIFEIGDATFNDKNIISIFCVVGFLLACCLNPFLLPKLPRKWWIMIGSILMSLCYIICSTVAHSPHHYIAVYIFALVAIMCFQLFLAPQLWIYVYELLPKESIIILRTMDWFTLIMVTISVPFMLTNIATSGYFLLALIFTMLCTQLIYFLPKTKGRTPEEIQEAINLIPQ